MKKHKVEEKPEQKEPILDQEVEMTSEETAERIIADIESLNQEVSELKDKNLRLMAEFDNFRKRSLKERGDMIKYAGEEVLIRILPLVDDFERALQAMETSEDAQAVKDGVDLIYSKFISFLSESGVNPIPTENEVFNTDLHEAITTFPAPSEDLKGKIIDCASKGYTLNDKVIRFAKVVVGE
ncbi:MAG: nucleotide exchange factor GrpE [Paludibacter sp.]|nr:nucleotide exchange factor GrpE [Paludibacter sp.]